VKFHSPLFILQNSEEMQLKKKKEKSRLPCTVFSPLMVVLLLSTMTQGDSCGDDKKGRQWCPLFFLRWPLLNSFFFCFYFSPRYSLL
jgi:hypothetical protein